jgi:MFS transporter, DHA2 family, multidrug resistance protein
VIGCLMFIAFGLYGSSMNGEAGRGDFFYVLVLRTFGISMMQLPLINQAVSGLSPMDYPGAIALNNMVRQLGGAFGVALANNFISTHYAQHRADLVSNLYATNPALTERLTSITNGIIARTGDATTATEQAQRFLNLQVDKQAYLLSYLDTYRMISVFFICIFPLIFFVKTKKQVVSAEATKAALEAH